MNKIILEMPIGVAMEFASRNAPDANVSGFTLPRGFTPSNTQLGGELGNVFVVFKIRPKFNFSTGFFVNNFTDYGDGWCNVSPRAAPDY